MDIEEKTAATAAGESDSPTPVASELENRRAFLASFTQEDNKAIMRKVDRRFLLLIGILYMTKNVCIRLPFLEYWLTSSPRLTIRMLQMYVDPAKHRHTAMLQRPDQPINSTAQSASTRHSSKHPDRTKHDQQRVQLGTCEADLMMQCLRDKSLIR